jgi:hypothetical protein
MRYMLAAVLLLPFYFAQAKGFERVDARQVSVFGFLVKIGDQAVISGGRHKYTLPWVEFALVNKFTKNHEIRQAEYKLPTQHLSVDAEKGEEK